MNPTDVSGEDTVEEVICMGAFKCRAVIKLWSCIIGSTFRETEYFLDTDFVITIFLKNIWIILLLSTAFVIGSVGNVLVLGVLMQKERL